jgi:hypothetical protein
VATQEIDAAGFGYQPIRDGNEQPDNVSLDDTVSDPREGLRRALVERAEGELEH